MGEGNRSAVGTLVERTTRLVLLLHLNNGRSAPSVDAAMRKADRDAAERAAPLDHLGPRQRRWPHHASFTIATGIPIYFCDPHAPWQRGTNENTNGLLRQYLPKGTDLSNAITPPTSTPSNAASTTGLAKPSAT